MVLGFCRPKKSFKMPILAQFWEPYFGIFTIFQQPQQFVTQNSNFVTKLNIQDTVTPNSDTFRF